MATCCVYIHMSESGEVLYVGATNDPLSRTRTHQSTAEWFPMVRHIEVLHFPHREAALQHERAIIMELKPRFNVDYLLDRSLNIQERRRLIVGERHQSLRAPVLAAMEELGELELAKRVGLNQSTLLRFVHMPKVVPLIHTVNKIEQYFSEVSTGSNQA